jgi:hypothetical protein
MRWGLALGIAPLAYSGLAALGNESFAKDLG